MSATHPLHMRLPTCTNTLTPKSAPACGASLPTAAGASHTRWGQGRHLQPVLLPPPRAQLRGCAPGARLSCRVMAPPAGADAGAHAFRLLRCCTTSRALALACLCCGVVCAVVAAHKWLLRSCVARRFLACTLQAVVAAERWLLCGQLEHPQRAFLAGGVDVQLMWACGGCGREVWGSICLGGHRAVAEGPLVGAHYEEHDGIRAVAGLQEVHGGNPGRGAGGEAATAAQPTVALEPCL
eukprot:1158153-Pelagomonas_calceolata.AAC.3